ncbi:MAG: cobalamin B12-binding domain-containing protein, partial [Desulfosudaceae bacterium]
RDQGTAADDILKALNQGIEKARTLFKQGEYALPDFLLAIEAYRLGTDFLKKEIPGNASADAPRVVIGVVEGDVHDMGKNIVAAVLEASGYQVTNLGYNVSNEAFLEALETISPEILALSTMMSTTLDNMKELIDQVRRFYPETLILIGGAPFDPDLARKMGADGYAENAITIPDETRRVLTTSAARQLPPDS